MAPVAEPLAVQSGLEALVDAAVTRYGRWAQADPVMLVHSATAPRAVALVLPSLPARLRPASYEAAWVLTATIATIYRPSPLAGVADGVPATLEEVVEGAVGSGDEHAIKFTEVAVESHRRHNKAALASAAHAVDWITAQ